MKTTDRIPSFLGGVSQQPDKLKFTNQLKSQINGYSNPVEGLCKRPPTEHIAKLMNGQLGKIFSHTIVKDTGEEYFVIVTNNDIKIFDTEGNEKTVHKEADMAYITTENPRFDIGATTIADHTFIYNKTKIVEIKDDVITNPYTNSALIFVKTGNPTADYKIYINDKEQATYTTTDEASTQKTNWIAEQLESALKNSLKDGWNIARRGSVVLVQNLNGEDFSVRVDDSNGFKSMSAIKDTASAISDLPTTAPDGFRLEITGDKASDADNYFVRFEKEENDTANFTKGKWVETVAVGVKYLLDELTMPHVLVANADGTFTYKTATYTPRDAGDDESNPQPSFIGTKINKVFTYKARIGYLANENLVLSSSRDIYNYWKETVLTELDTDRIDTPVTSTKGSSILRHAEPFDKNLLLFSDNSQFALAGGNVLSEKTVSIDLTTGYESSKDVAPVNAGSTLFFAFDKDEHTGLREYFVNQSLINDAEDITSYVPTYLPAKAFKMINSTLDNTLCMLFESIPNRIYVYKYYYTNNTKQQSSWSYWEFNTNAILNIDFIKNKIYMINQYDDGVYLEKINLTAGIADIEYINQVGQEVKFNVLLDRKIPDLEKTYDETKRITTFTFPYPAKGQPVLVDDRGLGLTIITGSLVRNEDNIQVSVKGDFTNQKIIAGINYELRFTLPHIYYRQNDGEGSQVALDGSLQLIEMWFNFARSGYFRVEVTPLYQDTYDYVFNAKPLGTPATTLNQTPIIDGEFPVAVFCLATEVEIEVVNDTYLPSNFVSAIWNGDYSHTGL